MEAKAGDQITKKALSKLAKLGRPGVEPAVQPKSDAKHGQWFCIDCGALPMNNMEANSHAGDSEYAEHPKHRLGWLVGLSVEQAS